jgi:hypothetical protein
LSGSWYCLDNDIILKLATCNLFGETLTTLDIDYAQVNILTTAKYKFKALGKQKKRESAFNYNIEEALKVTKNCSEISEDKVNQDILIKLQDIEGIDGGEAILISYVSYLNQQGNPSYLLTGDKRCLKALANSGMTEITQHLNHKVWCLEQLILKNIEEHGFDCVKQNIVPVRDCDTALKAAFGSGELATLEGSTEALKTYLQDLRQNTGNLLNSYPEKLW